MAKFILLSCIIFSLIAFESQAQVGIGILNPKAFLHVAEGKNVLFGDTASGQKKFFWRGDKGALQVGTGYTSHVDWMGKNSFSAGNGCLGFGESSIALGWAAYAYDDHSVAIGRSVSASGIGSVAIGGNVNTRHSGSIAIGDGTPFTSETGGENQFVARFLGGYTLTTGINNGYGVGATLGPGQSAWETLSDSTSKERFLLADGAAILKKIARMRLGSWNYIGQDAKQFRHYGPMAQDFFAAFGQDNIGIIGNDKTINQADFDGINLIAIKALIEQNEQLKAENQALRSELALLQSDIDQIKKTLYRSSLTATSK